MKSIKFKKYKNTNLFKEALEFAAIGNRGVQLAMIDSQKETFQPCSELWIWSFTNYLTVQ